MALVYLLLRRDTRLELTTVCKIVIYYSAQGGRESRKKGATDRVRAVSFSPQGKKKSSCRKKFSCVSDCECALVFYITSVVCESLEATPILCLWLGDTNKLWTVRVYVLYFLVKEEFNQLLYLCVCVYLSLERNTHTHIRHYVYTLVLKKNVTVSEARSREECQSRSISWPFIQCRRRPSCQVANSQTKLPSSKSHELATD